MTSIVDTLLAGPRGRRLLLELAVAVERAGADGWGALSDLLFYATYDLGRRNGTGIVMFGPGAEGPHPTPSIDEIAEALDAIRIVAVDDLSVLRALVASVDGSRPWQDPDETDQLMAHPSMSEPLRRIAVRIAESGAAEWMTEPLDLRQWVVEFDDPYHPVPDERPTVSHALAEWREEQGDERGGTWWSTPPWPVPTTTRALPLRGPVGLWAVEDGFGLRAATTTAADAPADARVHEIGDAEGWAELCRAYPLDATELHHVEWGLSTGWQGRWAMPDWSIAAHDLDAVHLTTAAYLSAAGTAIPVEPGVAGFIAGWSPDTTYWLTDALERTNDVQRWESAENDDVWRRSTSS